MKAVNMLTGKKNIFVITGSAGKDSANERLTDYLSGLTHDFFHLTVFKKLKTLPHFDPELSIDHPPQEIVDFRKNIARADGIIICTPEYVFSIPAGLKNAIEWCVSTTVFSDKPTGLITASANGQKGHEELQLIMKTLGADFTEASTLLIRGIKGKIDDQGQLKDESTYEALLAFINAFKAAVFNQAAGIK